MKSFKIYLGESCCFRLRDRASTSGSRLLDTKKEGANPLSISD